MMRVILSTAFLNSGRDEEFLKGRGRGFQRRMVEGKKEYRCWSFMERGTIKLKGGRGEFVGKRIDFSVKQRWFRIL